ncbi:MAG: V-type ATP synthase subunit I [Saccharospirillum sp.]
MSIQTLQKITLIGLAQHKLEVLDRLQQLGLMHVLPMRMHEEEAEPEDDSGANPELLRRSLHYLLSSPFKRRQVTQNPHFDLHQVLHQVDTNRSERIELGKQRDTLEKLIKDLEPWGDFEPPDPARLNRQQLWLYLVPNYRMRDVEALSLPWMVVHKDNRATYVVVIAEQEPDANLLPVPRTLTGDRSLSQLKQALENTEVALETNEAEREALTRWIYLMQRNIAKTEDDAELASVASQAGDFDELFAIQGWMAERDLPKLEDFANTHRLVWMAEPPAADEAPPTLLDNPERLGGGQEVVGFFQTPGYRSWDPSRVVFFSFVSFFAIILSDVGYSLLLGVILAWYWKRLANTETHRRLRAMGAALVGAGVIWGVLVGSYFGASAPLPALQRLKVLDLNDFDTMMALSITIGAAHLILGNLIMAWVRRHRLQALSSVGWAVSLGVALLGWLTAFTPAHWGIFGTGLVMVLLFSSPEPKWRPLSLVSGLLALTKITQMFGDTLSYLRLFALGLASASLAITFNQLGSDVADALPGIGLLLEILILILGHLLNFALTVVSGVIHGLRLNLIEFYNWSLADEGYPFQPFAKQEITPWTT